MTTQPSKLMQENVAQAGALYEMVGDNISLIDTLGADMRRIINDYEAKYNRVPDVGYIIDKLGEMYSCDPRKHCLCARGENK